MYTGDPHRDECDRARELASRKLDGDLTEFDLGVLRMHLRDCGECAQVAAAMEGLTRRIRRSARLQPAAPRPVVVSAARGRRRRSARSLLVTAGALAATAAAAGAGAVVASHTERTTARPAHMTTIAELAPLDHQFRSIREGRLLLVLPAPPVRSPHRRGIFT